MDLFEQAQQNNPIGVPLADQLRPQELKDFIGQKQVIGPKNPIIQNMLKGGRLTNLIFWGPPGTGKTTLAHLLAKESAVFFEPVNAIETGAKKIKELGEQAKLRKWQAEQLTLLFIDEIHRLNKAQQDVLLPFTEKGDFVLIGATTENPSYELNSALLSRCQVLVFERLELDDLLVIAAKAFQQHQLDLVQVLGEQNLETACLKADGDARKLLNILEVLFNYYEQNSEKPIWPLSVEAFNELVMSLSTLSYDKKGDDHYNTISAFIKSVRGSDPDAAIYYLARMLKGGEDPVFIARRLVILASEDIGNADPRGLSLATAGLQAVELVGMPEAGINLAQVTTYLASAPKSNRSYIAYKKALSFVERTGSLTIPKALRSSQTRLTKQLGFGKDYKYSHDGPKGHIDQNFFPSDINERPKFYEPSDRGFEKTISQYLEWMKS